MQGKLVLLFLFITELAFAQKKPLNHTVYDSWENTGLKKLSDNGQWTAFTIVKQEGDGILYFKNVVNNAAFNVPRASNVQFTADSKFAAFLIKPTFQEVRTAKIKKKKPEELHKDTLGIANLLNSTVLKIAKVKSFKISENGSSHLAYQPEPQQDSTKKNKGTEAPTKTEGTDLIVRNFLTGSQRTFNYVNDYQFSKDGKLLVLACTGSKKDKAAVQGVFLYNTEKGTLKTLVKNKGNFKGFIFDEDSEHLAFLGESSPEKAEIKDYSIYYNSPSLDTAQVLVDREITGMPAKWAVSGDGLLSFSKDGEKLFFGIAPIKIAKDTTLVDFEHAKLDIWGYKDDYLQPMQLKNLEKDLKRSFLSVINIYSSDPKIIPLTDLKIPDASIVNEGLASYVLASTDAGYRLESQWTGESFRDYYLSDLKNGTKKKILSRVKGAVASPGGNYIIYTDGKNQGIYTYAISSGKTTQLNDGINVKFNDEENDVPAEARPYGIAGWTEEDKSVLIYDKYDIWSFSPDGKTAAKNITNGFGRQNGLTFRYQIVDPEERFITKKEAIWLTAFNRASKENGFYRKNISDNKNPERIVMGPFHYSELVKAKNANRYLYDKSNYTSSPNIFTSADLKTEVKLSNTNLQQQNYNWGTAELVKWTTPKGLAAEGILYKPEDFDPTKKYPMIVYFYEKLSSGLYDYIAPAPTPSRLNISFFVSNGYLVFAPDISYEIGYPGKSAEEFINSGVESLKKNSWVEGSKIGIQGQSWGGYQVAHLITRTNMYAAAWAGAPVANMTSAYGGIRWDSGMNRQFQYEKTQSRIGATLWEKPELYIENSPLFSLPKVNTPVVIMSNDADGAVPWYQGIEMFTGLKRLGKPSWLLNYNNEAHNLMQRQNRKDIQIREQQFFDYYLKGAKAPVWMTGGIPSTEKGKSWGFELTDDKP